MLKTRTLTVAFWRNLKPYLEIGTAENILKARTLNCAFWHYLKQCFYFSILWLSIYLCQNPYIHICIAFFAFESDLFFGFQFKSLPEQVNEYATLRLGVDMLDKSVM